MAGRDTRRIIVALVILASFTAAMLAIQFTIGISLESRSTQGEAMFSGSDRKSTFTRDDFRYGPQSWRPYAVPLAIGRGTGEEWYLMFVTLNGTPYGSNPLLHQPEYVKIGYRFRNLSGTAAFHIYGARAFSNQFLTNRQDGYGSSAYYVTGNAAAVPGSMPETMPLPASNHVAIVTANPPETSGYSLNDTYLIQFDKGGFSGLDALHICLDPSHRKGDIVNSREEEGSFCVIHTGGSMVETLILMVAVDRPQPADFGLTIHSEPVEV